MLLRMNRQASKSKTSMTTMAREELLDALFVETPELRFTPRGDPDPRIVRLVEFMAQEAAREFFENEIKRQSSRGS